LFIRDHTRRSISFCAFSMRAALHGTETSSSRTSHLTELARLKGSGDISADEYEVMQARLIGVSADDGEPPPAIAAS
jgi:hypothetical protein